MRPAFLCRKRGGLYEVRRFLPHGPDNRLGTQSDMLAIVRRKNGKWFVEGSDQDYRTLREAVATLPYEVQP